jgi:ferrous iron transport protein B
MTTAAAATPIFAVVGNPNAGKTSLFNALTGARQKVGNYPGVTVERRAGAVRLPDGRRAELIDLPGTYSLTPASPDEAVTRDAVLGHQSPAAPALHPRTARARHPHGRGAQHGRPRRP